MLYVSPSAVEKLLCCWGGVVDTRMGRTILAALILGSTGDVPTQRSLLINWLSPVSSMRGWSNCHVPSLNLS